MCSPPIGCQARGGIKHGGHHRQPRQVGCGFVRQLRQPQASDQGQQACVGHGARIVLWIGLASEGKAQWLRRRLARQVVNGVPGAHEGERQQQTKRNARCKFWRQERQQLDEHRAQPVGQRASFFHRNTQHLGTPPATVASGHLQHHAKGGDVGRLPGLSSQKTGQHVSHAKQNQREPRQATHCGLAHEGGGDKIHGGTIQGGGAWLHWSRRPAAAKKKQPGMPAADGCVRTRGPKPRRLLGGWRFGVTVAEALDATTHVVHAFLGTGVEGMRLA